MSEAHRIAAQKGEKATMSTPSILAKPNRYYVVAKGSCLYPEFQDGDYVLMDPKQPPKDGDIVHLITSNGEEMVKRYRYKENGRIWCEADWPKHIELEFEAEVLGVAMAFTRPLTPGMRRIPVLGIVRS